MNCQELQKDIQDLKKTRAAFAERVENVLTTGKDSTAFRKLRSEAEKLENSILEKYVEDFAEHNPECTPYGVGDLHEAAIAGVTCACALKDKYLLLGGSGILGSERLELLEIQDDLSLKPADIELPEIEGHRGIYGMTAIDENTVIFDSNAGTITFLSLTDDNNWEVSNIKIDGFNLTAASTALQDGRILVENTAGQCCIVTRHDDGSITHSEITQKMRPSIAAQLIQLNNETSISRHKDGQICIIRHPVDGPLESLDFEPHGLRSPYVIPLDEESFLYDEHNAEGASVYTDQVGTSLHRFYPYPPEVSSVFAQLTSDTLLCQSEDKKPIIIRWNGDEFVQCETPPIGLVGRRTPLSVPGIDANIILGGYGDGIRLLAKRKPSLETVKDHLEAIARKSKP